MKLITLITTVVLSSFIIFCLSACTTPQITGSEREQIITNAEPMTDDIISAVAAGDYTAYTKNFDPAMLKASTELSFLSMRAMFEDKLGAYKSRKVERVEAIQTFIRVTYTLEYEKSNAVIMRLVLTKDTPPKVTGLWFDAAELRK